MLKNWKYSVFGVNPVMVPISPVRRKVILRVCWSQSRSSWTMSFPFNCEKSFAGQLSGSIWRLPLSFQPNAMQWRKPVGGRGFGMIPTNDQCGPSPNCTFQLWRPVRMPTTPNTHSRYWSCEWPFVKQVAWRRSALRDMLRWHSDGSKWWSKQVITVGSGMFSLLTVIWRWYFPGWWGMKETI